MSLLPVFLKLEGRPCLVVGAGEVASGKIESLVHSLALVTVVAPWARPEIVRLAEQRAITWHQREFVDSDIQGAFVIVAGTNHVHVNQHVYRLAVAHNILCNAVDDPPHCDFYYGSVVSRGKLQIAISTAGESPSVAQRLRAEIDALLPHDLGPWLCKLGALRRDVLEVYPAGEDRKQLLARLSRLPVCESLTCPARDHAFPPHASSAMGTGKHSPLHEAVAVTNLLHPERDTDPNPDQPVDERAYSATGQPFSATLPTTRPTSRSLHERLIW